MQVEKTFIVAEPIEEWIDNKKIILGHELRKVYTDFDNTYYIIVNQNIGINVRVLLRNP